MITAMVIYGDPVMPLLWNKDVVTKDSFGVPSLWFDSVGNCCIRVWSTGIPLLFGTIGLSVWPILMQPSSVDILSFVRRATR